MAAGGSEEPFMVSLRQTKERGVEILSWHALVCTASAHGVVGAPGLQKGVEEYKSAFLRLTTRYGWQRYSSLTGMLLGGLSSSYG